MIPWLRERTATVPELEGQLQAAQAELADAETATAAALQAFDDDPGGSAKQLAKARDREALAREHVGRAERLLAAAREREAQREREAKAKRLQELERLLSNPETARRREPALAKLLAALEEAAAAEAERLDVEAQIGALHTEREHLARELHGVEPSVALRDSTPNPVPVADSLERLARDHHGQPIGDVYRRIARTWGAAR